MNIKNHIFLVFLILACLLATQTNLHANTGPYHIALQKIIKLGQASWYSKEDPGIKIHTANNEIFDDTKLTAAMWNVPFNQRVRVTNVENNRSVIVRVNDRGPHKRFVQEGRIIDLTKEAFSVISPLKHGLIQIELELL